MAELEQESTSSADLLCSWLLQVLGFEQNLLQIRSSPN